MQIFGIHLVFCLGESQSVEYGSEANLRSSSTSSVLSELLEEYQGLRSLADGASATPFSVSPGAAFFAALIAAAIAF